MFDALVRGRLVLAPAAGRGEGQLLDRDPAAERDRRAAHGARAERLDPGRPDPPPADARACRRAGSSARTTPGSAPRRWSRRSSRPRGRRASSSGGRSSSGACGSGGISTARRSSSSSSGSGRRPTTSNERFTMDDAYARAVIKVFVELHARGHVYRDNYMVNWDPGLRSAISDLEVEQRTSHRHALLDRLPAGGRLGLDHGRHGPAGDDAGGHRGRRASRGRALPRPDRQRGDPAAGRSAPAGDRRRARRPGVRHRLPQDHPGPRPQRLRDRAPRTGSRRSR